MTTGIQQLVLDYIQEEDCSPLIFRNKYTNPDYEVDKIKEMPLDDLVYEVVKLSNTYNSYNAISTYLETYRNRWRSSLDIWRHCLYFNNAITIFQVMDSLARNRSLYNGHFCGDIERRVFRAKIYTRESTLYDHDTDEYGLHLYEWEGIQNGN